MKILALLLCLIVCNVSLFAQSKTTEQISKELKVYKNKYYGAKYDKFKDYSIVACITGVIGGQSSFLFGGTMISTGFEVYYKGSTLNESPKEIIWKFGGYSNSFTNSLNGSILYVIADNERFEFKQDAYLSKTSQDILNSIKTMQSINFILPREDALKISKAKITEIKLAEKVYKFSEKQIKPLVHILTTTEIRQ